MDPADFLPLTGRGETYQALGRYEEAVADFSRAIELAPDAAIAERAATYRLIGRYDDALAGKDEAIDETPAQQPYTRQFPKVGRNDPCPCGSGKKYKYCHGALR